MAILFRQLPKFLDNIVNRAEAGQNRIMREVYKSGSNAMVDATPQKKGVLVSNHIGSVDVPSASFIPAYSFSASGSLSAGDQRNAGPAKAQIAVTSLEFDIRRHRTLYTTNNTPYSETRDRFSSSPNFHAKGLAAGIARAKTFQGRVLK